MEVYFSTDVEANGPIPGPNSMLSFGSVAILEDGKTLGTFEANLHELPGSSMNPNTKIFWDKNAAAYAKLRLNLQEPGVAMNNYTQWVETTSREYGLPVFVGYPVAWDFMYVYWYLIYFTGKSPFSHSAVDMKTMAMMLLKKDYRFSTKRNFPKRWFSDRPHTHGGLDDALEQGDSFLRMLKESRS